MIETVGYGLIHLCVIAIVIYLVIYVITQVIMIPIPPQIITLLWCIVAIYAIIYLVTKVFPAMGIRISMLSVVVG